MVPVKVALIIFICTAEVGLVSSSPIIVRAGILLTENSTLMYDMRNVRPALEVAFARALVEHNVHFEPVWVAYDDKCKQYNALGHANDLMSIEKVDVIIGPGCSDDMVIVCELTTYYPLPLLIGAGELIDTTFMYPWLIRFSYNTYSLWIIFVKMMKLYQWKDIALIRDCCDFPKNVTTRGFLNILADENIEPYEIHFKTGSINKTAAGDQVIRNYLKEASVYSRIFVLSMNSLLLRRFMLQANALKYCEGEYAFFTLDLYQDDIIGTGKNGWKQNDTDDAAAKHAYASLFILTLMDKRPLPTYQQFQREVREQAQLHHPGDKIDINYHTAAFHDSVIMFAVNVNMTVTEGIKINRQAVETLTQRFWGRPFEGGASGRVYIDQYGDRSDDHTLYHMHYQTGDFVPVADYYGYKKAYEAVANITWPITRFPNGTKARVAPLNRPLCGYLNDDPVCAEKKQPITEITIGVAFGLLVLLGLAILLVYRKIKEEAALFQWTGWPPGRRLRTSTTPKRNRRITMQSEKSKISFTEGTNFGLHADREVSTHSNVTAHRTASATFRGTNVIVRNCERHKIELNKQILLEVRDVRTANHENLLRFVGAILGPERTAVITELCSKGNLQNLLLNNAIKLDDLFKNSLVNDMIKAMVYIHQSTFQIHGRLTSRCCWIDSRFVLKIGDYGLPTFYATTAPLKPDNVYWTNLLWKSPEELQFHIPPTQEGDVYSFGIILQEVLLREEPFSMFHISAEEIVRRVIKDRDPPFRPKVEDVTGTGELVHLMRKCWADNSQERPKFTEIRQIMREVTKNDGQQTNIMDALLSRMESYAQNLESIVEEKTQAFLEEKRKSDQLLNQVLPRTVAEQLKKGEPVHPESFESVTIYFSDIVGFTTISSESSPMQIVDLLNDLYTCFDTIITRHDVYKVETIGDSYMCVSGLPIRNGLAHAVHIARMALTLLSEVKKFKIRHRADEQLKLRIGMHSGPCVSGVVGLTMPRYCLFGDTVNVASRMESTGEALKIQISGTTKAILDSFQSFVTEDRGEIAVKGKGQLKTYWLIREN
ncbi:Atrial natriuretic peptide receptor 1 [Hypsibius exemplaris]|uniref:Guanylate cyclase n=1 Tax=Hypsibius exemplaris TaxID=2072580 RepID=A0A1W0X2E1_HYPEX|nr:Atrial natriuretic peptide receptor 1 [Hypsibius exemplaris]